MNFFRKLSPAYPLCSGSVLTLTIVVLYGCRHENLTAGTCSRIYETETNHLPSARDTNAWKEEETAYILINLIE